jgi:hypothetical protein
MLNKTEIIPRVDEFYTSISLHNASMDDSVAARNATLAASKVQEFVPNSKFDIHLENLFEYPALAVLWNRARSLSPEEAEKTIFLYFHMKGMTSWLGQGSPQSLVHPQCRLLMTNVIGQWRAALAAFDHNIPKVNKAGYIASPGGFIWFNFWFARGTAIQTAENPQIHPRNRFYYESWLGSSEPHNEDWFRDEGR